ncbi:MAG: integrase arm-type DNA-binding domain-containing protein [Burkholderiales bacterium]|nr:integrase arm-type DNA-binding domain-containing protein [Burkholderiales bacterium]
MAKLAREMGALEVGRLTEPGLHAVGGVPGLMLQVTPAGSRSWVLRVRVGGKRREAGLGGYPAVTMADARRRARELREQNDKGIDPVAERRTAKAKLRADRALQVTFKACAEQLISAHEAGWKNPKHRQQWDRTLRDYAFPVMGELPARDVTKAHVLAVLEPIWTVKTETATRVRSRIERVLNYAMQAGYRPEGLNPARWKGGLDALLPSAGKLRHVQHHPAVPVGEIAAFMVRLRAAEGIGAKALDFTILTAARSGETRGATWAEIDLAEKVWTVPGGRAKAGREHRVPLSADAVALLQSLPEHEENDLVFPAPRGGKLSDMTLSAVLRRMSVAATVHGFRSTFRTWAGDRTSHKREVIELALAHRIGDAAEQAYSRGEQIDKRRRLMDDWAAFVGRITASTVTPINAKAAA